MSDFRLDLNRSSSLAAYPGPDVEARPVAERVAAARAGVPGAVRVPFTYLLRGATNERNAGDDDHLVMGEATVRVGNLVRADLPKVSVELDGSRRTLAVVDGRIALPVERPYRLCVTQGRVDVDAGGSPFLVSDGENVRIASESFFSKVDANEGPATRKRAIRDASERLVAIDGMTFRKDCWTYVDVLPSGETHLAHVFRRDGRLHVDRGTSPVTDLVALPETDVLASGSEFLAATPHAATVRDLLHAGDVVDFLRSPSLAGVRSPGVARFATDLKASVAEGVRTLGSRQARSDALAEALETARTMVAGLIPQLGRSYAANAARELLARIDVPSATPAPAP